MWHCRTHWNSSSRVPKKGARARPPLTRVTLSQTHQRRQIKGSCRHPGAGEVPPPQIFDSREVKAMQDPVPADASQAPEEALGETMLLKPAKHRLYPGRRLPLAMSLQRPLLTSQLHIIPPDKRIHPHQRTVNLEQSSSQWINKRDSTATSKVSITQHSTCTSQPLASL